MSSKKQANRRLVANAAVLLLLGIAVSGCKEDPAPTAAEPAEPAAAVPTVGDEGPGGGQHTTDIRQRPGLVEDDVVAGAVGADLLA